MMGSLRIPSILLLSCFLLLFFSPGFMGEAREIVEHVQYSDSPIKENEGKSRKMIDVMDYAEPGPNNNTRNGLSPPPPPL